MKVLAKDLRYRQWFLRDGRKCEAAGMVTKSGECLHLSEGAIAWIDENCEVELIEPCAEPTYTELQAEWCNDHGIEVGSRVKVTRRAKNGEQGWQLQWMYSKEALINTVVEISRLDSGSVVVADNRERGRYWHLPYFVLDPVKTTYRPYTDEELLEQLGAKVRLKSKDRSHGRLITDVDLGTAVIGLERVSAEALRNKYEHLDGTACGVEE